MANSHTLEPFPATIHTVAHFSLYKAALISTVLREYDNDIIMTASKLDDLLATSNFLSRFMNSCGDYSRIFHWPIEEWTLAEYISQIRDNVHTKTMLLNKWARFEQFISDGIWSTVNYDPYSRDIIDITVHFLD